MKTYIVNEGMAIAIPNEDNTAATPHQAGEIVQLDPEATLTQEFLKGGLISEVEAVNENPESTVTIGAAVAEGGEDKLIPPTQPSQPSVEPRKRYKGKVVVAESVRTVEGNNFQHIATEDGQEFDLTDVEYRNEVHVSYPPQA